MANNRILWIMNYTLLREFEVPILKELGYEVFCPKRFGLEHVDGDASVDYIYDNDLTIPQEIVKILNSTNFYKPLSKEILDIINEYFDIAFCMPVEYPLRSLIYSFNGSVVLRDFEWHRDVTCAEVLESQIGIQGLRQIAKMGKRFWFGVAFNNYDSSEPEIIRRRSILFPLGVSASGRIWTGGSKDVLFVCPQIKSNQDSRKLYNDFCSDFGDIPHLIAGDQLVSVVDDDTVLNSFSQEKYHNSLISSSAMFYYSQASKHMCLNIIEAIECGIPLVFMAGGLLDYVGGKNLPGRCKTINEAKKKLLRLSKGNGRYAKKLSTSQSTLLKSFSHDYCKEILCNSLYQIKTSNDSSENTDLKERETKRIVVIMPALYLGGVLDYSIRLCYCIKTGSESFGDSVEVTFAYPDDSELNSSKQIEGLKENGIKLRPYRMEEKDKDWFSKYLNLLGLEKHKSSYLKNDKVCIFNDGINYLSDFDFAVVTSDYSACGCPFFLDIPHAVVAHDYIQHYVPNMIHKDVTYVKLENERNADHVFVTSEPTFDDAISYAGLSEDRIHITPYMLEYNDFQVSNENVNKEYFLWSTNAARHKNHIMALKALNDYYIKGGSLDCFVTGANTKFFDESVSLDDAPIDIEYVKKVREEIQKSNYLKKHLRIMGNLDKESYYRILANARYVFHPGYADNGNGTMYDAASYKVPVLSSDYPAMKYMSAVTRVPVSFMDSKDVNKMVIALFDMQNNGDLYKERIPEKAELIKADYRSVGEQIYKVLKEVANI